VEYHIPTNSWSIESSGDARAPTPRDRHSAVVYGNAMYVFGGCDGQKRYDGKIFEVCFIDILSTTLLIITI
jgi:hypothetical protein